ncbi:hypothetical protein RHMOL_Rhmol04G0134700 [Rhododendron molle]|uniref:Uncharacterized protein n=1 Tax=Rhododendron molle TaxID=49168 RepID=A0ACC0P1A4_RHOML|nr:hypothetical protein RHMOL_Rhmol04G0134700 [Rhododendron molle]
MMMRRWWASGFEEDEAKPVHSYIQGHFRYFVVSVNGHREISGSFTAYKVIEIRGNDVTQFRHREIWSFTSSFYRYKHLLPFHVGPAGS